MKTERTQDARKVEPSVPTQPALTPSPQEKCETCDGKGQVEIFGGPMHCLICKGTGKRSPQTSEVVETGETKHDLPLCEQPSPPVRAQSDEGLVGLFETCVTRALQASCAMDENVATAIREFKYGLATAKGAYKKKDLG